MARPKSVGISLDQQIEAVTQTIQARYIELKGQLDQLSDQYFRITGQDVTGGGRKSPGRPRSIPSETAAPVSGKTKAGKKRLRKQGVRLEWLQEQLGRQPMTLQQLQSVAEKEGLSALSVMNVLRANKAKFKTQPGEKKPGVKGVPASIYSTK